MQNITPEDSIGAAKTHQQNQYTADDQSPVPDDLNNMVDRTENFLYHKVTAIR
jgi:hypothetical protein